MIPVLFGLFVMTCYLFISALTLLLGLTWPIFDLFFVCYFRACYFRPVLFSAWAWAWACSASALTWYDLT
jgi:hypothetical protein